MSLNWNLEKVKDRKEIQQGTEANVTDALIWATMVVGIGEITEANADEFYKRLHMQELLRGSWLSEGGKPSYITREDVKRRIGLWTNAGRLSRAAFNKNILKHYYSE